jgi:hypothetical protein
MRHSASSLRSAKRHDDEVLQRMRGAGSCWAVPALSRTGVVSDPKTPAKLSTQPLREQKERA